jgi:hypothetical protein
MSVDKIRTKLSNIKKHKIIIESQNRDIGISLPTDFDINLGITYTDIVMYEIDKIIFPYTNYIINDTNNQFRYTDNSSTPRTLIIPNGDYDIYNLLMQIKSQMEEVSNERYETNFTYGQTNFNLNSKVILSNFIGQTFSLDFAGTTNSIASILGYENINYTGTSFYIAPNNPNFSDNLNIKILSNTLTSNRYDNYNTNDPSITNILWDFNLNNYNFGDTIIIEPSDNKNSFRTKISSLNKLDFKFIDNNNNIINTNGFEIYISINLYTRENNNNFVI